MTSYQTFLQKITKGISEYYGADYKVALNRVKKNNGAIYCGITIQCADSNVSPTVYMEEMYREYLDGETLSGILQKTIQIYEKHKIEGNVDMQFLLDYEQAKDRVVYRLIHYENNRALLEELPHIKFLDMAVVFYCQMNHEALGDATILLKHELCCEWGVQKEELLRRAQENTPLLLPAVLKDMRELLQEWQGRPNESGEARKTDPKPDGEYPPVSVLSNKKRLFGAACMLYPGVLRDLARKLGRNIYILPSSVHELLLVTDDTGFDGADLTEMVYTVNRTQLEWEEVLSDSIYYYDREKDTLQIWNA